MSTIKINVALPIETPREICVAVKTNGRDILILPAVFLLQLNE